MIIYNVTLKVDKACADQWLHWMKTEHAPEMMRTGLFSDYRICRLLEQDEREGPTFVVQYNCDSMEHYEAYLSAHADAMRQKGLQKFGDQVAAFRTLMETLNERP
jgi:hypothetical protein